MLYSRYHECPVSPEEAEKSLDLYLKWCEQEKVEPEVDPDQDFEQFYDQEGLLGTVVYYAQEFMGMNILLEEGTDRSECS
jgi:hypothetical protein